MLPLFGLFADEKTGRYKIIIAGIYTPLVSSIIDGFALVANIYSDIDLPFVLLLGFSYFV